MSHHYCTRSDVEAVFGPHNIQTWADLDNDLDEDKIEARVAAAIDYATHTIDSKLARSIYYLPLQLEDGTGAAPPIVVNICAKLAGVWLYECRGVDDWDPERTASQGHRLRIHYDVDAIPTLKKISIGEIELTNAMRKASNQNAPMVVPMEPNFVAAVEPAVEPELDY